MKTHVKPGLVLINYFFCRCFSLGTCTICYDFKKRELVRIGPVQYSQEYYGHQHACFLVFSVYLSIDGVRRCAIVLIGYIYFFSVSEYSHTLLKV
jgi:hypothetical protein